MEDFRCLGTAKQVIGCRYSQDRGLHALVCFALPASYFNVKVYAGARQLM